MSVFIHYFKLVPLIFFCIFVSLIFSHKKPVFCYTHNDLKFFKSLGIKPYLIKCNIYVEFFPVEDCRRSESMSPIIWVILNLFEPLLTRPQQKQEGGDNTLVKCAWLAWDQNRKAFYDRQKKIPKSDLALLTNGSRRRRRNGTPGLYFSKRL